MDVPVLVVCFGALLVAGVLLSELANRTVLSTAVLFLVGGFLLGPGVSDVLHVESGDPGVTILAELALFSVLYSDGMRVSLPDLRRAYSLPGRALLLGLPLTLAITAALAHWVAGLPWLESFLLGAVLAPTDPVFAAAVVGREEVPPRLRRLLNVESGINDGLALPIVLVLLAAAGGESEPGRWVLAEELALGVAIGVAVPLVVLWLERLPWLASVKHLQPLLPAAIGLLVLGLCLVTHANLFLAAFAAGITVASAGPEFRHEFEQLGELVAEQLKLVAILVFAALMTPSLLSGVGVTGWAFAVLALVLARPVALLVSFAGARLTGREQAAAMWFGPKGFASVVYGLLVLESGIPMSQELFELTALTVSLSILAHSSTDVVVARQFVGDDIPSEPRPAAQDPGPTE